MIPAASPPLRAWAFPSRRRAGKEVPGPRGARFSLLAGTGSSRVLRPLEGEGRCDRGDYVPVPLRLLCVSGVPSFSVKGGGCLESTGSGHVEGAVCRDSEGGRTQSPPRISSPCPSPI